jgi:hypothetical protein
MAEISKNYETTMDGGYSAAPFLEFTGLALVYFLKSYHHFSTGHLNTKTKTKYLAYNPRTKTALSTLLL